MIRLLFSLILIAIILGLIWKIYGNEIVKKEIRKVKFADNIENFVETSNTTNLEKMYSQINPSNFYTQNYNTPNFTTNVTDLRKFYDYDLPANNPIGGNNNQVEQVTDTNQEILDKVNSDTPWLVKEKQTGNATVLESDFWSYKNELPMNGGSFGGIVGYESIGESLAYFNQEKQEESMPIKSTDDLRNGMGTPQKQKQKYDMSQI
jgi:hypothetical protein